MTNALLYLATTLVWGSSWIAIEFQLGVVPTVVSVFYRFALAAILLFAWCAARGLQLRFSAQAHSRFILLGVLLFFLVYQLSYHGQQYISSALAAIAFSTMLWMNIINSRLFFGARAGRRVIAGSLLGIVGIAMLFAPEISAASASGTTMLGVGYCLLGALLASFGNMLSQKAQSEGLPVLQSNAWGMLYGALFAGTGAWFQEQSFSLDTSPEYLLSLGYLVIFASIVGFGSYLKLLGRIGAQKAGYTMVSFPLVALAISYWFEGLDLTPSLIVGVILVLSGNLFVLLPAGSGRKKPPAVAGPVKAT